jgi:hypothetical protein
MNSYLTVNPFSEVKEIPFSFLSDTFTTAIESWDANKQMSGLVIFIHIPNSNSHIKVIQQRSSKLITFTEVSA